MTQCHIAEAAEEVPLESDQVRHEVAELVDATRDAERAIFAALPAERREASPPDGGWSAKDVQVHLTAWKRQSWTPSRLGRPSRRTDRFAAHGRGNWRRMASAREETPEPAIR